MEDGYVEIDLDATRAEALVEVEDEQLREVLAWARGKDLRVKYTGRGLPTWTSMTHVRFEGPQGGHGGAGEFASTCVWTGVMALIDWG